jgi:hypothetical protein
MIEGNDAASARVKPHSADRRDSWERQSGDWRSQGVASVFLERDISVFLLGVGVALVFQGA